MLGCAKHPLAHAMGLDESAAHMFEFSWSFRPCGNRFHRLLRVRPQIREAHDHSRSRPPPVNLVFGRVLAWASGVDERLLVEP